jgi:CheY-like chemotaxis protein
VIDIRCPACDADLSELPLSATDCPVCGEELHVTIDLRDPSELTGRRPTVLIVDRDRELRQQLTRIVEEIGFQVVADVSNGPDAVLASQRLRPMFVLLDRFMKAITGEETARLIREVSPKSVIVSLSGDLRNKPEWAEAELAKTDISKAAGLLRSLVSEHRN